MRAPNAYAKMACLDNIAQRDTRDQGAEFGPKFWE